MAKQAYKVFKGVTDTFPGYGVQLANGCIHYEAMFSQEVAGRIVELECSPNPPKSWHETKAILEREGFDLTPVDEEVQKK